MSYITLLYITTEYHHQDSATASDSEISWSFFLTCERYHLFLSSVRYWDMSVFTFSSGQRRRKYLNWNLIAEWITVWICRTLLTLLQTLSQQKQMSIEICSLFLSCIIKSFLSLLHRGIPGKKCGTIVLSVEELSNCRVSKPLNSRMHVSVQNQIHRVPRQKIRGANQEAPTVRKAWRSRCSSPEQYEVISGQVGLLFFESDNQCFFLTQSGSEKSVGVSTQKWICKTSESVTTDEFPTATVNAD